MDAASNNSVDDIRELRERVAFAPLSGKHTVYMLDEPGRGLLLEHLGLTASPRVVTAYKKERPAADGI